MIDRLPPQSLDSEQAVLGSILIDRDAIVEVADFLRPADFYRAANGTIYAAMLDLYGRREPIDVVTVAEALERSGELANVGGPSYLSQLGNNTPTAVHVEQYGRIVERKALGRSLIQAAGRIAAIGYEDSPDTSDALDRAQQELLAITERQSSSWAQLRSLLPDAYDYLGRLAEGALIQGIASGIASLDRLTGGFMPGDLVVLAARPSVGKTACAIQVAQGAARDGIGVGLFSLEMSKEQIARRILAGAAGIDTHMHVSPDSLTEAAHVAQSKSDLPLWIDDSPTATPLELRTRARRLAASQRCLGLLIVDYLQLAHCPKSESREREVADISRQLKALARELRLPILVLSQLNRDQERRGGAPRLSDLRESGAIEQDADVVLFLWRSKEAESTEITLTIAKQRNGPAGVDLSLHFDPVRQRFEPVMRGRDDEPAPYWSDR